MKKLILLSAFFNVTSSFSQNKFQIGIGGGYFFLQKMDLHTGNIGLKFKQDKNVFIDFNKSVSQKHKVSTGIQALMNLSSDIYELNKAIPYYSEKDHIPIFMVESVEVNLYLKKYFEAYKKGKIVVNFYISAGPSFNINEGDSYHRVYSLRDDDRNQSFEVSFIDEKAQRLFVPYLRISGGVEIFKALRKKHYIGISPFFTWAGLQSENNDVIVLRNDPTYISRGSFKRNRNGYGIRLIISK
ncbi:MAG TPA: hypothetical protein PKI55_05890 [Chitinophagaceae bacterium]|nr:hypothetical protein [Chitinophagaceae bacterium]